MVTRLPSPKLITGPFRSLVSGSNVNYNALQWSDLPGTNGRYRVALARTELMVTEFKAKLIARNPATILVSEYTCNKSAQRA